jgi:hypothetical protein
VNHGLFLRMAGRRPNHVGAATRASLNKWAPSLNFQRM